MSAKKGEDMSVAPSSRHSPFLLAFSLLTGILIAIVAMLIFRQIPITKGMWWLTGALAALGVTLTIWAGYLELQRKAPGGILIAVGAIILIAATGIMATVSVKVEQEEIDRQRMLKHSSQADRDCSERNAQASQ